MTRSHNLLASLLALTAVFAVIGATYRPSVTSAGSATPSAGSSIMAEATVDDVTIRLLSWQQDSQWQATIEAANGGSLPVSFTSDLIHLDITLSDGESLTLAPLSSSLLPCSLAPGAVGQMTLDFKPSIGQTPVSLTVGLAETNRTGAYVVFPLNSNNGPSAVGGNGIAGNSAPATGSPTVDSFGATPAATPANVCTN